MMNIYNKNTELEKIDIRILGLSNLTSNIYLTDKHKLIS